MSRVAVVTGAARGIGAATVDALVADGYRVVAVDRCRDIPDVPYAMATPADLDALVGRHGEFVLPVVGDVRSARDMALAVATATDHFGRLDALVAVAGVIAGGGPLWEMGDGAFDAVWSVSVLGTRRLIEAGVPAMLRGGQRDGRVVAVSSAAGVLGLRHLAAYSAAKHAVIGLIRGVAMDLAETGITANVICPDRPGRRFSPRPRRSTGSRVPSHSPNNNQSDAYSNRASRLLSSSGCVPRRVPASPARSSRPTVE